MFLLRKYPFLLEGQQCLAEMCKVLSCNISSGKHIPVRVLPPLSKQMIGKNFKSEVLHVTEYKKKGVYGVMDMAKRGQVEQAEQLFKKLQAVPKLKLGVGVHMSLFDMHVKARNAEGALNALQRLHLLHPHVILQPYKVLSFATLLLENGHTERCLQLLQDEAPDEQQHSSEQLEQQQWAYRTQPKLMTRLSQQLLQVASARGDVLLTQRLLDLLLHHGFCISSRPLLTPLVKVHLVRSDPKAALRVLEDVAKQHKCLPCKAELMRVFIDNTDTESLTRLLELSCAVIGRPHSIFDLAVAFLEAGQLDKAARVIREEEVYLETERLQYLCKLYVRSRQPQHLQSLLKLSHISGASSQDAIMIQAHLYACHVLAGDSNAAQVILAEAQKEGVTKEDLLVHISSRLSHFQSQEHSDNAHIDGHDVKHTTPQNRSLLSSEPSQTSEQDTSSASAVEEAALRRKSRMSLTPGDSGKTAESEMESGDDQRKLRKFSYEQQNLFNDGSRDRTGRRRSGRRRGNTSNGDVW